jgi:hypothetical protein
MNMFEPKLHRSAGKARPFFARAWPRRVGGEEPRQDEQVPRSPSAREAVKRPQALQSRAASQPQSSPAGTPSFHGPRNPTGLLSWIEELRRARVHGSKSAADTAPSAPAMGPPSRSVALPLAAAVMLVVAALVPAPMLLPFIGVMAFSAAGGTALAAWITGAEHRADAIDVWDVIGGAAFIGAAAGAMSRPEQILQFFSYATLAN